MPTEAPKSIEERLTALYTPDEPEKVEPEKAEPVEESPAEQVEAVEAEKPAEPEEKDDAVAVETLADLAEVLGIEVAELYKVRVPVHGADNERLDVSLSEWKDGYQSSAKAQKAQADLDAKRAAFEAEQAQVSTRLQTQLQQTESLLNAAENQLLADFQGVNWDELRTQDPAEWAARRQNFVERERAINTAKQQATSESQRITAEQAQKQQAHRAATLQQEAALLRTVLPEWQDESKAKAEQVELRDYLVSAGFPAKDVDEISNHRLIVLARKAMLFDKRQQEAGAAKKKLVTVAKKVLKPGASDAKAQQKHDRESTLRARLKKSGSIEDAAALLLSRR